MGERDGDLRDPRTLLEAVARALGVALVPAGAQTSNGPPLAPVSVAAGWVGMSERGFRKLIARGEVPACKVGRSYVVLVDEWMARLRAQAGDYSPGGGAS